MLKEAGYSWNTENEYTRAENFATIKIRKETDVLLKLDFVNDLVPLFGEINKTALFYRTDSIRNMLSNKLSAVFRYAAKDIADIRKIALHEKIDWPVIIKEARQKETGLELIYISEILTGIPQSEYEAIAWTQKPSWEKFSEDNKRIAYEIINCNSE